MSYAQFGYAAFTPSTQLVVGSTNTSSVSSPCCGGDNSGRASSGIESSTVCSLPATYDSRLLTTYHPRLYEHQAYPNFTGVESSAFYPSLSTAYGMKDAADPWRGIASSASYYYDPSLAAYGYGGLDFNGARRKNVTRDSTSTLKAWLNEHRKNPYPTKGEKIMLAIITKMTLTQVSTWFANARRRLKKENKMTWEPRNKMDSDDVKDFDDEDDDDDERRNRTDKSDDGRLGRCESEDEHERRGSQCENSLESTNHYASAQHPGRPSYHLSHHRDDKLSGSDPLGVDQPPNHLSTSEFTPTDSSSSPSLAGHHLAPPMDDKPPLDASKASNEEDSEMSGRTKPKIWSLADTATSKSPPAPPEGAAGNMMDMLGHCGWFSMNPYQVTGTGFGGYHPTAPTAFSNGQCSSGQGFPPTDTPPQTPPNMKVSGTSSNYLHMQNGQLYNASAMAGVNSNPSLQGSKGSGTYSLSSQNRSYRHDVLPEDYSATGNFRPAPLQ